MADREALKKSIQTSNQPPVLEKIINAPIHTAYRVVVYRMNVSGLSVDLGTTEDGRKIGERSMEYLLNLDPSNPDYIDITNAIANDQKDTIFMGILNSLYGRLNEWLTKVDTVQPDRKNRIKNIYRRGGLVQETDITALVSNIASNFDIEGINTCNITLIDPALSSVGNKELQRLYNNNPWLQLAQNGAIDFYERQLPVLKKFKFREFDLVRVYTYSSMDQSFSERVESLKTAVNIDHRDDLVSLLTEYSMPPSFTGFVQSINDTTTINSVSTTTISCMGVSRILSQTSNVIDQALANQVVLKSKVAGKIVNNITPITPKANVFSGNSSLEVFAKLLETSLYPLPIEKDKNDKDKKLPIVGMPSLSHLYSSTIGPKQVKNVVPLFPSLVALHYVKEKFSELIYYCDDATMGDQTLHDLTDSGIPTTYPIAQMLDSLRPYMYMLKNNFELYESTYQSPYDVIGIIRSATYMEVFEDRTGALRFRFPKYNNAEIEAPLGFNTIASININRSDSNNFSIVQTRFMADLIGAMRAVVPNVFLDALSVLRFGLRMTATIENPNAISATFSKALGPFIKYYSTLRESRTATINIVGDSKITVGQMASFRYGYKSSIEDVVADYRNAGISSNSSVSSYTGIVQDAIGAGDYVGYITNIAETIGVDQVFSQVLTLKFVRDAWIPEQSSSGSAMVATPSTILFKEPGFLKDKVMPFLKRLFVANGSNTFSIPTSNPQSEYPLVPYNSSGTFVAAFSHIPSALTLAQNYKQHKDKIDSENRQARKLAGGKANNQTTSEIIAAMKDIDNQIEYEFRHIGVLQHKSSYLYSLSVKIDLEFVKNRKKYMTGGGYVSMKAKLAQLNALAYNTAIYNPDIKVPGVLPDYAGSYGERIINITKKDYYPTVDQMMFVVQDAHNRKTKKYNFKNDFTALLNETYSEKDKSQEQRWKELWVAFMDAMIYQYNTYQKSWIPFSEKAIRDGVNQLHNYSEEMSKPTGAG